LRGRSIGGSDATAFPIVVASSCGAWRMAFDSAMGFCSDRRCIEWDNELRRSNGCCNNRSNRARRGWHWDHDAGCDHRNDAWKHDNRELSPERHHFFPLACSCSVLQCPTGYSSDGGAYAGPVYTHPLAHYAARRRSNVRNFPNHHWRWHASASRLLG
jgi:hypothetical protein